MAMRPRAVQDMPVDWFDVTLRWYLVTLIVTIALLPVALVIFRRVPGEGASFARPVSALVFMWPVWFLSSISGGAIPYSAITLWASTVVIGAAGWAYVWRRGLFTRDTLRHLLVSEVAYLAVFAAFLVFRGFGPDANWQEKPSDLMMLSSVMASSSMPPHDAWLAGESINYYYLGYAIWGGFGNMAGATPAEVFNLALISTFAMTFVAASGVVAGVLGRFHSDRLAIVGGGIASVLVLIMGNPWATQQYLGNRDFEERAYFFDGIGWKASRTIIDDPAIGTNPITEFPAFSFILGDLHPHVMALPFTVLALGLAWMLLTVGRLREGQSLLQRDWFRFAIAGGLIGSLYAMNSWDFPTYLVIALMALGLGTVGSSLRERLLAAGIVVLSALIAWLPFYLHFEAPALVADSAFSEWISGVPVIGGVLGSVAAYTGERTSPQEYFGIFGFMYLILVALILTETWRRREDNLIAIAESRGGTWEPDPLSRNAALVTAILCFFGAIIVPVPLLVICGLPVIMTWLLLERDGRLTPANVSLVLFSLALILTLVPEFFYLSDVYGGSRMNTVFKVSYQVWLLMAIASALAAASIWRAFHRNAVSKVALPVALAGIMVAGFVYPVVAGQQWLNWRAPDREWDGVDGLAYLNQDAGGLYSGEYAAIEWLLENADEDDVLLTAGGGEWWSEVGRPSGGSGVPTIIGWSGHENQWRLGHEGWTEERQQRVNDILALYDGTPPEPEILDRYGVTLIYIGPTETNGIGQETRPGDAAPGPFPAASDPTYPGEGWTEVFNEDGSRIYRRDGS